MKSQLNISSIDIKNYLTRNKGYYFLYLVSATIGIFVGFVLLFGSDLHLAIFKTEDKILFDFVTGSFNFSSVFWKMFLHFIGPALVLFLLGLNYYTGLISFCFIAYQSAMLVLSIGGLISLYSFGGVLVSLFFMLPVNVLYFCSLIIFSTHILKRSKFALENKYFLYGFRESSFWIVVGLTVIFLFLLAVFVVIFFSVLLKNAVFIIF